jgi:hypothetical protein
LVGNIAVRNNQAGMNEDENSTKNIITPENI